MHSKLTRFLCAMLTFVLVLSVSATVLAAETKTFADDSAANEQLNYSACNTSTNVLYEDVTEALNEAAEGQTVKLLTDTSGMYISIYENTVLDLNGCTLTANYVSGFGHIIDSSADNTGLLIPGRIMISNDNAQLPVKDGDGYRFVEVVKFNSATQLDGARYVFQPIFEEDAHAYLAAGAANSEVTIEVAVSWKDGEHTRIQRFIYSDDLVNGYIASYRGSNGGYGLAFGLTLERASEYTELSYDACVISGLKVVRSASNTNGAESENNTLTEDVTIDHENGNAFVAAGTLLEVGTAELVLTATKLDETQSDITLGQGEEMISMDVHVDGIAKDNTVPVLVTLNELALTGLNQGNIALYHVENGETVEMTRVYSLDEVDEHNEYYYDIATGTITMALASFSEVAVVADTENAWNGNIAESLEPNDEGVYEIFNADQLAKFGQMVDNGETFEDKTVRLMLNVNLSDGSHSDSCISFDPIGFGYEYDNGKVFKGTFDGNGNTIYNLYQNGWELNYSYSTAGGGLFASVSDATIKNLTMDNAYVVMECIDMGTVVGYAQGNCTFENIVVKNSTLANYQRYTGGAIGEVSNGHHILKNVDVEASTTVSSLWGDFDASLGGIIGGKWGHNYNDSHGQNGHQVSVYMENCDSAATLNAYNDVTSAYQWYSYRRAGMLIGNTEESKKVDGRTEATASYLEAVNCTVQYGDWVNYTYCEFGATTSLNARYPWVRVKGSEFNGAYSNPRYGVPAFDGKTFNVETHTKDDGFHVDGDGHDVSIVFNQLYGGGQGCYGGNSHVGVTIIGKDGTPVTATEKFKSNDMTTITTGSTITLGELFQATGNGDIQGAYVYAFVSPTNDTDTVRGTAVVPTADGKWEDLTITFTGTGTAKITISDYYYCTPTTITVTVAKKIPTYTAPTANTLTYTGSAQALVNGGTTDGGTMVYSLDETGEYTTNIPTATNAGTYTVYYKINGNDTYDDVAVASVTVTIEEAIATGTATATKNWTYDENGRDLISSDNNAVGGDILYSTDGINFSDKIPTATDAGEYTVYYKVVSNDSNYTSSEVSTVTVTVDKAQAEMITKSANVTETYDGQAVEITPPETKGGTVMYKVEKQTAMALRSIDTTGYSTELPVITEAGTYTVSYIVADSKNYYGIDNEVFTFDVVIEKAASSVTAPPTANTLTYSGSAQALIAAGTGNGGTMVYRLAAEAVFSEAPPTGTDAGNYTVYYKVEGDSNHTDSEEKSITVTIAQATPSVPPFTTYLEATEGDVLSTITLDGGFSWVNGNQAVTVGENTYKATYDPSDDNFKTVTVEITVVGIKRENEDKFAPVFPNTANYLYRVGNENNVTLGQLFKAVSDDVTINSASVVLTVTGADKNYTYSPNDSSWTQSTLKFANGFTGPVTLTITDNAFCNDCVLHLEIVNATNVTKATDATSTDIVLINGFSASSITVSGGHTLYGNQFTITFSGDGSYGSAALSYGFVTVKNGILDSVQIKCKIFPYSYMYTMQMKAGTDGRYPYGYSAVVVTGNSTISNCYIYGARNNIQVGTGNVVIENTVTECASVANIQIKSAAGNTVTLDDVTTIQYIVDDDFDLKRKTIGFGVLVGDTDSTSYPTIKISGDFNQRNWVTETDKSNASDGYVQAAIQGALDSTSYHHYNVDRILTANMGIAFLTDSVTVDIKDSGTLSEKYKLDTILINGYTGRVYSIATGSGITPEATNETTITLPDNRELYPDFALSTTSSAVILYSQYDSTVAKRVNKVTVDLDSITGGSYDFKFADLTLSKYGNELEYSVLDSSGNTVDKNTAITLNSLVTHEHTLVVTDNQILDQNGNNTGTTQITELPFTLYATKTSIDPPKFTNAGTATAIRLVTSSGGDWRPAYTALTGVSVTYWSASESKVKTVDLSTLYNSGTISSNVWTYTCDDYTLTITGGAVHSDGSVITPVVANNTLYFASTNKAFGTGTTSRSIILNYVFTDDNASTSWNRTETVTYSELSEYDYNSFKNNGTLTEPSSGTPCFTPDTLINLADGSQKEIQYVTSDDMLLVWDFYNGEYAVVPPAVLINHGEGIYDVITLTFDNNEVVKVVGTHGFLNAELNKWVYIDADNVASYVDQEFICTADGTYGTAKLIDYTVTQEQTIAYSIFTVFNYNCFAENMLSLTPPMRTDIGNYYVPFEIGEGLKYDEAAMQADIEKYGLYTYEDFAEYVTYEQFVGFNAQYFKVSVGKGLVTYEQLIESIYSYVNPD